ncbi:MAG: saccharopine dehydrogenase NADP-binding domain-containing protein [Deltaproteobacteria bacterium]|nr:saccharopine dehydrogenase NADP-binding domain-containing protein [Deltaproteobacteria bacterium]
MTDTRDPDIVLFGATGYTGRLVAEELLVRGEGLRWALAGRDLRKLEAVKAHLVERDPAAASLPLLVADSHDRASLDAVVRRARVICTTVGPYALHGRELVAACAESGTHYCDLTGEAPFMRQTIDRYHTTARRTGARIVHACGFDSIPSDLGALLADEAMRQRSGGLPCESVTLEVVKLRGGASGGTLASMLNLVDAARRDPEVRRILLDPYSLNPEGERQGPDGRDRLGMESTPDGYLAPFVMGAVNTRVVRRTNALSGYRYGREFRYREVSRFPRTTKGFLAAAGMSAGLAAFMGAVATPGLRTLVASVLPKPGEGPSTEERERGLFRIVVVGERRDGELARKVSVRVEANRDPGYGFTAVMLAESALCLALDPLTSEGGVLTPAVAMGLTLVNRLRDAGMVLTAD